MKTYGTTNANKNHQPNWTWTRNKIYLQNFYPDVINIYLFVQLSNSFGWLLCLIWSVRHPPLRLRYRCCCSWHWWESETESVLECEIVELMLAIERAINHNRIIRVSDYLQIRAHYQYGFVQSKLKSALLMPLLRALEFDQTCSTNTYAHTSFQCTYTHRINVDFVCCSFFLLSFALAQATFYVWACIHFGGGGGGAFFVVHMNLHDPIWTLWIISNDFIAIYI